MGVYTSKVVSSAQPNTNQLAAWWAFDGDLTDSSGNGYDMAPDSSGDPEAFTDGVSNEALFCHGSMSHVKDIYEDYLGDISETNWTIAAWVDFNGSDQFTTICSENIRSGSNNYYPYGLYVTDEDKVYLRIYVKDNFGSPDIWIDYYTEVYIGWHHVANTYDATTQTTYIYVDGVLITSIYVESIARASLAPIRTTYFRTVARKPIDNITVHARTLTQPEIMELMQVGVNNWQRQRRLL